MAGDEHGGGHRRAASSGKYSCDAPHRGSLARRILPSGKLHIWDAFFLRQQRTQETCYVKRIVDSTNILLSRMVDFF